MKNWYYPIETRDDEEWIAGSRKKNKNDSLQNDNKTLFNLQIKKKENVEILVRKVFGVDT